MFGFIKRNKKVENNKVENDNRYDGKIYKGVWQIGDDLVVGAYKRDGNNNFITANGVYVVPRGVKKTQLKRLNDSELIELGVDADSINHWIKALENDFVVRFLFKDEL